MEEADGPRGIGGGKQSRPGRSSERRHPLWPGRVGGWKGFGSSNGQAVFRGGIGLSRREKHPDDAGGIADRQRVASEQPDDGGDVSAATGIECLHQHRLVDRADRVAAAATIGGNRPQLIPEFGETQMDGLPRSGACHLRLGRDRGAIPLRHFFPGEHVALRRAALHPDRTGVIDRRDERAAGERRDVDIDDPPRELARRLTGRRGNHPDPGPPIDPGPQHRALRVGPCPTDRQRSDIDRDLGGGNVGRLDADRREPEGAVTETDDGQCAPRMDPQHRRGGEIHAGGLQGPIEDQRTRGQIEQPHPADAEIEAPADFAALVGAQGNHRKDSVSLRRRFPEGCCGMPPDRRRPEQRQGDREEEQSHQQHRGDRANPAERDHRAGQRVTEPHSRAGGATASTAGEAGVGIHSPPRLRGVVTAPEKGKQGKLEWWRRDHGAAAPTLPSASLATTAVTGR